MSPRRCFNDHLLRHTMLGESNQSLAPIVLQMLSISPLPTGGSFAWLIVGPDMTTMAWVCRFHPGCDGGGPLINLSQMSIQFYMLAMCQSTYN